MEFSELHDWNLTSAAAIALQRELAGRVIREDRLVTPLRRVAGTDVSCRLYGRMFHAAVVVFSFPELEALETASASLEVDYPYIPGLLSFRELPVLLKAFQALQHRPDLVLVDGQGIAHPRGLGVASHLGLWLDLPTIGCAKSRLYGTHEPVGEQRGDFTPLHNDAGDEIGVVLRSRDRVKPLYVSPGHRVSVATAAKLALDCGGKYRLPEPTRAAHQASNSVRRAWEERQAEPPGH